mmetsp:Transcript_584/g.939  ORF Transcript_584/g.939 Transcript_584/m.939 type:complete len:163 (-) Transcript_584:107-595(-)
MYIPKCKGEVNGTHEEVRRNDRHKRHDLNGHGNDKSERSCKDDKRRTRYHDHHDNNDDSCSNDHDRHHSSSHKAYYSSDDDDNTRDRKRRSKKNYSDDDDSDYYSRKHKNQVIEMVDIVAVATNEKGKDAIIDVVQVQVIIAVAVMRKIITIVVTNIITQFD